MNKLLIGELLLSKGVINKEQLETALEIHKVDGRLLSTIFIEDGYIGESDYLRVIAQELGYEYIDQPMTRFQSPVSELVSETYAKKNLIIPLYIDKNQLYCATSKPLAFVVFEELSMMLGLDVRPLITDTITMTHALEQMYRYGQVEDTLVEGLEVSLEDQELMARVASAPVVKLVNSMISTAYMNNASDLHINPEEHFTLVRLRVDGQLQPLSQIKKEMHEAMVTRIKIIAGMNIAEKRVPQDGSFTMDEDGITVDIRVASIPTKHGEKLVLRLLGSDKALDYDLDKLDFDERTREFLKQLITIPNGIILITGPTGSGKTTTLYSMLAELSVPEKAVITIEDPVEKYFEGITQVRIHPKAGLDFASGLRSILRLDPDVIMLGEIRDSLTADIAIRAAITGHMVLSTLHTNDALSSITRLIDMGVEPFMVASSVKCVIAQRLVRKNCQYCKVKVPTSQDERILLGTTNLNHTYKGIGCNRCDDTGYSGRKAIFEVVPINDTLQDLITNKASYQTMKDVVIHKQQLPLLKDDVVRLLKGGDTSISEARKVLFNNDIFKD